MFSMVPIPARWPTIRDLVWRENMVEQYFRLC